MSLENKPFPIMGSKDLKSVPWWLAESARAQLNRNHGQTVERLAERGGLCLQELAGALTCRSWSRLSEITERQSLAVINHRLTAWDGIARQLPPETPSPKDTPNAR